MILLPITVDPILVATGDYDWIAFWEEIEFHVPGIAIWVD